MYKKSASAAVATLRFASRVARLRASLPHSSRQLSACLIGGSVQNKKKERWEILCQQAAVERDPQKLLLLVRELNEALKEREERLNGPHKASEAGTSKEPSDPGDVQ
jgi:hypothetical protein